MPVRVPQIPGLNPTRIGAAPVNPAAAAAPARALGSLAGAIANVSEPFEQIADRVQSATNARQVSEARNQLDQNRADFLIELDRETDPQKRLAMVPDFLQGQKGIIENPELAPIVRDQLIPYFDNWATDLRNQTTVDAAQLEARRAGLAIQNELNSAYQTNNPDRLEGALGTAVEAGLMLPEEADKERANFNDKQRLDAIDREIHADPGAWLDAHPHPTAEDNLTEYNHQKRLATTLVRQDTAETTDQVLDLMAQGKIRDVEHLEELTGNLRPAAQDQLKVAFARRQSENYEALRRTPDFQNQVTGQVRAALRDYDANPADFDSNYVAIAGLIDDLPTGPTKTELSRILRQKRDEQFEQLETNADRAHDALGKAWDAGRFGTFSGTFSATAAIDAGLLEDPVKLRAAGFSEEQIEEITDEDLSRTARTALFRREYAQRPNPDSYLAPLTGASYQAIAEGESKIAHVDPVAQAAAEARYGEATRALDVFLANPENAKNWDKVQAFITTLEQELDVDGLRSELIEPYDFGTSVLPPLDGEIPVDNETNLPPR